MTSLITEDEDNKDRKLTEPETEDDKKSIRNQLAKGHVPAKQPLIWQNIIGFVYGVLGGLGVTAGAHRFWAHRSYSAKLPLKIMLACFYCMAGQTHLTKWIRVHRTHHKYTDTPADPHNASRGFFFSHVGWLMMKHHPAVKEYGKSVNLSDIAADPVIRFFDKYYPPIMMLLTYVVPSLIPVYLWNETWIVAIGSSLLRHLIMLNAAFAVNSFAHLWGSRPYSRNIKAAENPTVSFVALGEGWHNYHHCFPWDYKAAELGSYGLNLTTGFIDFMAWLGYYPPIMLTLTFILPTVIPVYFWNESWIVGIGATLVRWIWTINVTFAVNSFAHLWGTQPYNKHIMAKQNKVVAFFTFGEGWHNYHHCFPWDYKGSEHFNLAGAFIDIMAWLGLAYDLKTTNSTLVEKLYKEKGDGSHEKREIEN
ncbi:acyl-CoA Delta(11) desaturase-like [Nylanderia fulva]|uniref:acyl-CoA Delta(11) desaturase-like n=1 Tax=Nylanderia fulva TaxID=613905 RepID=UPI0010FB28F9|nr:acyl-CoA Delta(11) desaturase-like [Nylanderia fulva]